MTALLRLARAGFDRHAAYRAASVAGMVTNVVFGLLRVAVLLAVVEAAGPVAGYDAAAVATYVWLGQGLLAVVDLWAGGQLSERVRSGEIAVDLSRPWDLQTALLVTDLGRAGHALLVRFLPPVAIGALFFPFRWPERAWTWVAFGASVVLAVVVCHQIRFLLDLTSFWLLDARGVRAVWNTASSVLCGLAVPVQFFPDAVRGALVASPFPAIVQSPVDVFSERGSTAGLLLHQLLWAVLLAALARLVLHRGVRKLVVQGG